MSEILKAIEDVGQKFHDLKEQNERVLAEERAGNEAKAKELAATLEKISQDLSESVKARNLAEKRQASIAERIELLEAMNDRPGKTVADKVRDEHKELMVQWLRSGGNDQNAMNKLDELRQKSREVKDVTVGSNPGGGFAVPEEISRMIDKLLLKSSEIAANVKNVAVSTPDYKELLSVNVSTSAWSAETGSRSAKDTPILRECAVTHGELYTYLSASNWSLRDVFFNVENFLVENASEGFAKALDVAIFSGDGSSKPTGMTAQAPASSDDYASPLRTQGKYQYVPLASPSSPITTDGLTCDTVINLVYKLNPRYRGGSKFAASTVTQGHLRKLKDDQGQYLWQPSVQAGQPDRLLGFEMFTWEDLGNPTSSGAYPLAFGDFRRGYTLALIQGMEIIRDQVTVPGYTKFYISRRFGGIPTNCDAVKFAKVSAS